MRKESAKRENKGRSKRKGMWKAGKGGGSRGGDGGDTLVFRAVC